MADNFHLKLLLKIIAQVDGLRDVEGLRESVRQLDPVLKTLWIAPRRPQSDGQTRQQCRNFGAAVKESSSWPLADLATNALKVSSVAAALATALGGAVYQEAKKFESAQLDLQKVLNGTQEDWIFMGKS